MTEGTEPHTDAARTASVRALSRSLASRVAHEHPTLVFTLAYLTLTAVGLIYDLWFFFYFKINILDYSETGDFLLAAIRNPLVIVLSILPIGLLMIGLEVREIATRKSGWYEGYRARYANTKWNSQGMKIASAVLFVAIYATVFTQLYAQIMASRVKHGAGQRVTIVRNNGPQPTEKPILLGSTTRFFFLYYPSRRETEVVPVDNMAMLTVDSRRRKEREADSAAGLRTSPANPR